MIGTARHTGRKVGSRPVAGGGGGLGVRGASPPWAKGSI